MVSEDKTRVYVTFSNDMLRQIRLYADSMGVTVSAFISMVVGEKIMAYNKTIDIVKELGLTTLQEPAKRELDYREDKPKAVEQ